MCTGLSSVSVESGYDQWALSYDHDVNRTRDLNCRTLREADLPIPGRRVFDAGCGTGLNTEFLAEHAQQVVAMDFSTGMLEQARQRIDSSRVDLIEGNLLEPWPAKSGSQDLVVITLVLEHVERLEPVFAEARRVLAEGGTLYVSELHPYRQLRGRQARFTPVGADQETLVPAWRHAVSDFVNALHGAGFRLQRMAEPGDGEDQAPRLLQLWSRAV